MLDQVVWVAAVTVLGVLEQAYFSLQVIYARRKYSVPPPATAGHPDFERIFRAHDVLSVMFEMIRTRLALSAVLGFLYVHGRYQYFHGYAKSAEGSCLSALYLGVDPLGSLCEVLGLIQLD
ncbi:Leukotriene C4 synthase [Bagarius yarrelli]|uniref:Leukotriene C4 synthase n=1 Tax=Bagarius yarrelli TaxID=175774 RepID=A0A556V3S5_BAGYA|nr:Leukotriene C4 synthase [Bagarius yarrelli]